MIKFKPTESQKEFLSVKVTDGTDIIRVKEHLCEKYESLADSIYDMDSEEILIRLQKDVEYGFCFNQLVAVANEVAKSKVMWFLLDFNTPSQRMIALESE